MSKSQRRSIFLPIYIAWIVVCAILFFAVKGAADPSRRAGRILTNDAADRAVIVLRQRRLRGYEAVHVAFARRGEGGRESRWVVLCDRVPHTALKEALVVELRAVDGVPIAIRKPVK